MFLKLPETTLLRLNQNETRMYTNFVVTSGANIKGNKDGLCLCSNSSAKWIAERLNRTLMEITRALLLDSGLEKELWREALRTAMYLLNRSQSATTVDTTPVKLWCGKRPDLSNLKLFGSLAYAKKIKEARKTRQEM
ncbi:hypothetical protein PR048_011176 [Dryococelus australis]|uniref:Integrase catalytic domain-containing protein n=1 Tax=Dryococelus australis TaxID=614101 RepID=A0ABQ9HLC7_9NEOP|nr:hypothetical protein PR048_011176 [Dryococelus australis]